MSSAAEAAVPADEPPKASSTAGVPPSPARSDKSSESEGRPVREKLKETRIDAHASSDAPGSAQPMDDTRNGMPSTTAPVGDVSTSGSDSERGRLRRKRSHDDFEDDEGPKKRKDKEHEVHARKKSRDNATPRGDDDDLPAKATNGTIAPIGEDDGDQTMHSDGVNTQPQTSASNRPATPETNTSDEAAAAIVSPKNKRTHEQANISGTHSIDATEAAPSKETGAMTNVAEGPHPKRQRDKSELQDGSSIASSTTKIPPGSGFANTSAASPFANLGKSQAGDSPTKPADGKTPDEKFKSSGFSSFSKSSASPFGGSLAGGSPSSPFAAATTSSKLSSFASPSSTSTTTQSGFGALGGSSTKSAFGGTSSVTLGGTSTFSGGFGGGFGSLGGTKSGISSFATPGVSGITGLSSKPAKPFGAQQSDESDGEDDGDADEAGDEDGENGSQTTESEKHQTFGKHSIPETGEEGEETVWAGRAKLYTLDHEKKAWQENGTGPFKLNLTKDDPPKARFIIRADGTHRLLLNAAVTKDMRFGTPTGDMPTDGKAWFNSIASDGKVNMHTIKMNPDRAKDLYYHLNMLQNEL